MSTEDFRFEEITANFVRIARGAMPQEKLSGVLGFDFNVVNRWENQRRSFYWDDFLSLAEIKKWNIADALSSVSHFEFGPFPSSATVLRALLIPSALEVLSPYFSAAKLNRLSQGTSKLVFPEFLLIIEVIYGRSERFLRKLIGENHALELSYAPVAATEATLRGESFLSLVKCALELKFYKDLPEHSDDVLAEALDSSPKKIAESLSLLVKLGSLQMENGKFVRLKEHEDTGVKSKAISKAITQSWRKRIIRHVDDEGDPENLLSAYLVYSTNPELEREVFHLCRKFYMDLKNLVGVNDSLPKDNIRYVGIDLFHPFIRLDANESSD